MTSQENGQKERGMNPKPSEELLKSYYVDQLPIDKELEVEEWLLNNPREAEYLHLDMLLSQGFEGLNPQTSLFRNDSNKNGLMSSCQQMLHKLFSPKLVPVHLMIYGGALLFLIIQSFPEHEVGGVGAQPSYFELDALRGNLNPISKVKVRRGGDLVIRAFVENLDATYNMTLNLPGDDVTAIKFTGLRPDENYSVVVIIDGSLILPGQWEVLLAGDTDIDMRSVFDVHLN